MKHKITISSQGMFHVPRLWYVHCECGWQLRERVRVSSSPRQYFGRETWDEVFAAGVGHQVSSSWRPV